MIDNFDLIKPLLTFENPGDFYFIQILQRKKDFMEKEKTKVIKEYFVENINFLDFKKKEMISLANFFNARVMIRLNKRNYEYISLKLLNELASRISQKTYSIKNLISSVIGKYCVEKKIFN